MINRFHALILMTLAAILPASPAGANDVFVGVSFMQSFEEADNNGFGILGGVLFEVSDIVQVGPEIGWSNFGRSVTQVDVIGTGYDRYEETYDIDMWHVMAMARVGKQGDGLYPFAQGGFGAYIFNTNDEIRYYNAGQEVPELFFEQSGSDTEAGVNGGGGLRFSVGSSFEGVIAGRLDLPFAFSPENGAKAHAIGRVISSLAYRF